MVEFILAMVTYVAIGAAIGAVVAWLHFQLTAPSYNFREKTALAFAELEATVRHEEMQQNMRKEWAKARDEFVAQLRLRSRTMSQKYIDSCSELMRAKQRTEEA